MVILQNPWRQALSRKYVKFNKNGLGRRCPGVWASELKSLCAIPCSAKLPVHFCGAGSASHYQNVYFFLKAAESKTGKCLRHKAGRPTWREPGIDWFFLWKCYGGWAGVCWNSYGSRGNLFLPHKLILFRFGFFIKKGGRIRHAALWPSSFPSVCKR